MNLLLIKPYNVSDHIQPSLGLGYLAENAKKTCNVRILDGIKEKLYGELLIPYLDKFNPDIVGFQIYTHDLSRVRKDIEEVKKWKQDVVIVGGGPHATAMPEDTFLHMGGYLDYIFGGESESAFPKFLSLLRGNGINNHRRIPPQELKGIAGLSWFDKDKFHSNEPEFMENLDEIGFPAWDLIRPETYPEAQHGAFYKNFPIAPVMTGRGCPFSCTFCAGHLVTGKKIRKRSVRNVIEEIKFLVKDFGIREIHIVDDNFSMYKDYVMDFCERLIKEDIKISWATPNGIRLDTLDREMLLVMKKSGYYLASVGIEFGSDRLLRETKKHLTKKKIKEGISLIRSVGLDVAGFFIIGYPGETEKEIKETIEFSLDLPLLRANFFIFLPLPGTESFFRLKKKLELDKVDWEHFHFTHATYIYGDFSRERLKSLQREAFLRFFLRPHIFYKNLVQIKSLRHFKFLLHRAYRWVIRDL